MIFIVFFSLFNIHCFFIWTLVYDANWFLSHLCCVHIIHRDEICQHIQRSSHLCRDHLSAAAMISSLWMKTEMICTDMRWHRSHLCGWKKQHRSHLCGWKKQHRSHLLLLDENKQLRSSLNSRSHLCGWSLPARDVQLSVYFMLLKKKKRSYRNKNKAIWQKKDLR